VLRKIFGIQREEVTGDSRKLHNEELHDCTSHQIDLFLITGDKIKKNEMGGSCNSYAHRVLVQKPEGKRRFADLGIAVRIILKWGGVGWGDVAFVNPA
jgi:hypothetical protein